MLQSADIALAPLRDADSDSLFLWINSRGDVLHNSCFRPVSRVQHDAWFRDAQTRSDAVVFAIRRRESDKLIGTCQLTGIHSVHRSAELRIRIGSAEDRGRGYGTQALKLLLAFAFRDLNLHRVWLEVLARNDAARRLYHKLGMVEEGVLREAAFVDGRYEAVHILSILRQEYDRRDPSA